MSQYNTFKRRIWLLCGYLVDGENKSKGIKYLVISVLYERRAFTLLLCGDMSLKNDVPYVQMLGVICKIIWFCEHITVYLDIEAGADSRKNNWALDVSYLFDDYCSMWQISLKTSTFSIIRYLLFIKYYRHWFPLEPILTQYLSW